MKVYLISPAMDVFDGSGVLSPDARKALSLIANMVADSLREGGDCSHQAVIWEGPSVLDQSYSVVALPDRDGVLAAIAKLLDPNDLSGGSIRSIINCRSVTFGHDGQAFLCLRQEDSAPFERDTRLVIVEERSEWLVDTDWLDGWATI